MASGPRRLIDFGGDSALQLSTHSDPPSYDDVRQAITWKTASSKLFGQTYQTGRLVATMGAPYSYNGDSLDNPAPMPEIVQTLCDSLSSTFGLTFNTCVANLYPDGSVGLGAHDDGEKSSSIIVSISFGAQRKITFTKKDKTESHSFLLRHGDICAMCGDQFQREWKHAIPKSKGLLPRISLTFRSY